MIVLAMNSARRNLSVHPFTVMSVGNSRKLNVILFHKDYRINGVVPPVITNETLTTEFWRDNHNIYF
jgi:hypothetical protein